MRDRVDRRYALLLGVVLTLWALANDLALAPPDLSRSGPAVVVAVSPEPPTASPAPGPAAATPAAPAAG